MIAVMAPSMTLKAFATTTEMFPTIKVSATSAPAFSTTAAETLSPAVEAMAAPATAPVTTAAATVTAILCESTSRT